MKDRSPVLSYDEQVVLSLRGLYGAYGYQPFRMSRFEHKRNSEIANELHISTKAVEFHITKALKVLRVNLKDYILCFLILFL